MTRTGRAAARAVHRLREHRDRRSRRPLPQVRRQPRAGAPARKGQGAASRRPTPTGAATPTTSASFHESAIELIEVPQKSVGGKNSADIRLVVDAMDMSFQKEHINCFVVCVGRLGLLAARLQAQGEQQVRDRARRQELDLRPADRELRRVHLLRGPGARAAAADAGDHRLAHRQAAGVLRAAWWTRSWRFSARTRSSLWGSMVKETMKRKRPSFNESYYGFRTFSHLLEDAQRRGIVIAAPRPEVRQLHRRGPRAGGAHRDRRGDGGRRRRRQGRGGDGDRRRPRSRPRPKRTAAARDAVGAAAAAAAGAPASRRPRACTRRRAPHRGKRPTTRTTTRTRFKPQSASRHAAAGEGGASAAPGAPRVLALLLAAARPGGEEAVLDRRSAARSSLRRSAASARSRRFAASSSSVPP